MSDKIKVYNPQGFPPKITGRGMAPRPDSLLLRYCSLRHKRLAGRPSRHAPPGPPHQTVAGSASFGDSVVMYFTGRLIISHSPVFRSYLQLQKASQLSLSMDGLSARK